MHKKKTSISLPSGWKLFQSKWVPSLGTFMPRTLVHGLPTKDGKRTTVLPLDVWIPAEYDTPGFNLFNTRDKALAYLPKFKVRGHDLLLCKIYTKGDIGWDRRNYRTAGRIMIRTDDWNKREFGFDLLA